MRAQPAQFHAFSTSTVEEMKPYDPLDSLEAEVNRFVQTNTFTPMDVTGFYMQARCVIHELKELRKENEYLRNVRERQAELIRCQEAEIIDMEEEIIALSPKKSISLDGETAPATTAPVAVLATTTTALVDNNRNPQPP